MIRKLHYCWFGGTVPEAVSRNVRRWRECNPGFEVVEWNEGNSHVSTSSFGKRALKQKKWCFASDIARLQALVEEGGFYLDTDVELYRPLHELKVDDKRLVLGYMYDCALGTAFLYAPPRHPVLKALLALYEEVRPDCFPVNNTVFTDYFINEVPGFLLNGKAWRNDLVEVYPKEFFEQPALIRSRGFCFHHCCGSWMPERQDFFRMSPEASHWLRWLKRKVNTALSLRKNEFYPYYRAALRGVSLKKEYMWRREAGRNREKVTQQ